MSVICYIGLGSNLAQPRRQIEAALAALGKLASSQLLQASCLYSSAPVGPQDQPDYINAVAAIDTNLAPLDLLDALQALETAAGRKRLRRWGERTLDLDILLYGDVCIDSPRLTIPHPQLANRAFVLLPLVDIAPALSLPNGRPISSLLAGVADQSIRKA